MRMPRGHEILERPPLPVLQYIAIRWDFGARSFPGVGRAIRVWFSAFDVLNRLMRGRNFT